MSRRYSEAEIGTLLQRATQLQEQRQTGTYDSLSLAEVEQIAAEMGVDPRYVRQAAREGELEEVRQHRSSLIGEPFRLVYEDVAEGSLTETQWEHMVRVLQRETGHMGRVKASGNRREWGYQFETFWRTHIIVQPQGEETAVQVQHHYRSGALTAYFIAFIGAATVAGVMMDGMQLSDLMNVLIAGASGLGGLGVVRSLLEVWVGRQKKKMKRLVKRLTSTLTPSQATALPEAKTSRSMLDLDENIAEAPLPVQQRSGVRN